MRGLCCYLKEISWLKRKLETETETVLRCQRVVFCVSLVAFLAVPGTLILFGSFRILAAFLAVCGAGKRLVSDLAAVLGISAFLREIRIPALDQGILRAVGR